MMQRGRGRDRRSTGLQQNGHRRQDGEGEFDMRSASYGVPDNSQPRSRAVTSPTNELSFPGRRVSPTSERGEDVESAVYVTPADTLNRSASQSSSNSTCSSNTTGSTVMSDSFSRSEKKNMQLHQLTMSQWSKRQQGGGGTVGGETTGPGSAGVTAGRKPHGVGPNQQKAQAGGETSDYSIPFNLLQGTRLPRPHHHHPRIVPQAIPPDNSELIIPINPPSTSPQSPSDRSDTTSPNSPRSNQSSEHEQQQHPQPSSSRPPDEGDYAVPWDQSRFFSKVSRVSGNAGNSKRRTGRRRNEESDDLVSRLSTSRGGSLRDQSPPPLPLPRYQSSGGGEMSQIPPPPPPDDSPPPPDCSYDKNRPWRGRAVSDRAVSERTMSDRVHNNTSPMNAGGWGHGRSTISVPEDLTVRSQSMSSYVRPGRRLPTPPGGSGGDWSKEQRMMEPAQAAQAWRQSNPMIVDPCIPLEDQP